MYIQSVSLIDFRNYEYQTVALNENVNIMLGNNAQGKTNFLEAIYFCATGRSKRAKSDKELVRFGRNITHIQLVTSNNGLNDRIDIKINNTGKKNVSVNGITIRKLCDLFGVLYVVSFAPEDLYLIKSGPSERRKFIDLELCQLSGVYYYDLQQYHRILKQRNNLLKELKRKANKELMDTLEIWDEQLVHYGIEIMKKREDFVKKLNVFAKKIHSMITNGLEELNVKYVCDVDEKNYHAKLQRTIETDIMKGSTNTGIHKDDLVFLINGIDARTFGSQGQQKTAALSAKLSEIEIIRTEKNVSPILLLDDVFSELDATRQEYLVSAIANSQTIITATGVEDEIAKLCESNSQSNIFYVQNGTIRKN